MIRNWSLSRFCCIWLFQQFFVMFIIISFFACIITYKLCILTADTILVKWCSWRRPLDCSNNTVYWFIWCPQEFPSSVKNWNPWCQWVFGSQTSQGKGPSSWIKLNVDQTGFYRVKYDEGLAARLRYAVEKQLLSATDRFGKLDKLLKLFSW